MTHIPEEPMLMQEKISGSDTLLKLYIAIDKDLKALQRSSRPSTSHAIRAGGRRS
jgi:hypothetical protein